MKHFERSVHLPVPPEVAFAWHEAPGAFERLTPPWEPLEVVSREGGIRDGGRATVRMKIGPIGMTWVAEHMGYDRPRKFEDRQISGPFKEWHHVHSFESLPTGNTLLTDSINYRVRFGGLGQLAGGPVISAKLDAMFGYRHQVTRDDLAFHKHLDASPKRIIVSGGSGLVGGILKPMLTTGGHEVISLIRREPASPDQRQWDPTADALDPSVLADTDVVIHLSGESIVGRWTEEKRRRIRESRIRSTRLIAEAMAATPEGPRTLVVASAIGIYGDCGNAEIDESAEPASGFLPDVVSDWEQAADAARDTGIRVVHVRLGVVLSGAGGALKDMLLPFQLGGGGPVGPGTQYFSWIAIDDAAALIAWAALRDDIEGPINATSPRPVTNREFVKTLARVLHRPSAVPLPSVAVKTALGEMGQELLLTSARVIPKKALASGYTFRFDDVEEAIRHELGRL